MVMMMMMILLLLLLLDQELVSCRYSSCCCCSSSWHRSWGDRLQKRLRLRRFITYIGMKFGTNVLYVNTHWMTDSNFQFDVRISRWRQWRHFMQKSAAGWQVASKHETFVHARAHAAVYASSWSIVHSYLFHKVILNEYRVDQQK